MTCQILRRNFLKGLGAITAANTLPSLSLMNAYAQAADYRALVCVFLYGGNDGNNTVVPYDTAGYAQYSAVRSSASAPRSRRFSLSMRIAG